MNAQDSKAEIFDVFLCHNSADKPAVREIAEKLKKEGIKPWLDEEQIPPGTSWQTVLGEQIESIKSAAVFVGDAGLGPWQNQESQALLNQFVKRGCPVIPVILPSAKTAPELPWMFANLHCVDLRNDAQPLKRLIWGITGKKPTELSNLLASDKPASWKNQPLAEWISSELSEKYRVPRKIARFWLRRGYLLPLLDGLDEMRRRFRPIACPRSMLLSKT